MNRRQFFALLRLLCGGKCSNCGRPDKRRTVVTKSGKTFLRTILEFHHPEEKLDNVTRLPRKLAIAEVQRCQLLCERCHAGYHQCADYFDRVVNDNCLAMLPANQRE